MTRAELISRTRQLIDEGERLAANPSLGSLQVWLQHSDDLLGAAWGSMDRFHMAWLSVGRPRTIRGRAMTADEEAAYVRDVAAAKTAVLRSSLDAAERLRMPFVGETGAVEAGTRAKASRASKPSPGEAARPTSLPPTANGETGG